MADSSFRLTAAIPGELFLSALSYLGLQDLGVVCRVSKGWQAIMGRHREKAIAAMYRFLLLREVGADLPQLVRVAAEDMDWRAGLRQWVEGTCTWRQMDMPDTGPSARYLHRIAVTPQAQNHRSVGRGESADMDTSSSSSAQGLWNGSRQGSDGHGEPEQQESYLCTGMGGDGRVLMDVWKLAIDRHSDDVMCEELSHDPRGIPARFAASVSAVVARSSTTGRLGTHLVMFGGMDGHEHFLDDTWLFDVQTRTWEIVQAADVAHGGGGADGGDAAAAGAGDNEIEELWRPKTRWGHASVVYDNHVFVFGGSCPGEAFNDLWCFTPESRQWRPISACNPEAPCPHRRGGHSATIVEGRYMYVFGGNTLDVSFQDLWRIDLRACLANGAADWEEVKPTGKRPGKRIGHIAMAIGHRLYIYGGRNILSGKFFDGVNIYDVKTNSWTEIKAGGQKPSSRTGGALLPYCTGFGCFGGLGKSDRPLREIFVLDVCGGLEEEGEYFDCD